MADAHTSRHQRAAAAFARRARERYAAVIESIHLFGSVVRGEERGVASDVDLLVVLRDDVDHAEAEEAVRDLAYDVELEHGVVLSLVVRSSSEYEQQRSRPFFQQVRRDGEVLYG